jgi:RNA polymerase sigma-54 factor
MPWRALPARLTGRRTRRMSATAKSRARRPSNSTTGARRGAAEPARSESTNHLEKTLTKPQTLLNHLVDQLHLDIADPIDRLIGLALIDLLDDSGYLVDEPVDIAARLNCLPERIEAVLTRLRQFDPPGLLARDLADCLVRERNQLDPAKAALRDNLGLLAAGDFNALARRCGVDAEDIAEMVDEIRTLVPKPAHAFEAEINQTVVPDVFVRPTPDGGWHVKLNSETLPRVLIDRRYHTEVSAGARTSAEREYLTEHLSQAT